MWLYLASSSPRRQALLRQIGIEFEVVVPDVDETRRTGETPEAYVLRLAQAKAQAASRRIQCKHKPEAPILAADTAVVLDDDILDKPVDRNAGIAVLQRLAGRTHRVLTGLCLIHQHGSETALSTTEVRFGPMTRHQCEAYWDSGESSDKAGGYAIQGRAAAFIAEIRGSYSGVVGLPLYELTQLLNAIGRNDP